MKKSIIIAFSLFCGSDQIIMPAWSRPDILLKRYKMYWLTKDINQALSLAVENNDPLAVKIALDEGADIDKITYPFISPPLSIAIRKGNEQIVQMLLKRGANLKIMDWHGKNWTPLHYAIYNNNKNIIEMLIKADIDLNFQYSFGTTELMFAVMDDSKEAVSKLLKLGADIFIKDNRGWTALDHALYYERKEIAKILIDAGLTDIAPSLFKHFNSAGNLEKIKEILSWFDPLIEEVNAKNKAELLRTLHSKFPRDIILNEFWPSLRILTGSEQFERFKKEKLKKIQRIRRAAQSRNATKRALLQQIDSQSSMYKDEKEKREFIEFKEEVALNMLQDEMRKNMPEAVQ